MEEVDLIVLEDSIRNDVLADREKEIMRRDLGLVMAETLVNMGADCYKIP